MALVRVTGRVTKVTSRSGTKVNTDTGEARDWAFTSVRVLVADQDVVEVTMFADSAVPVPAAGDQVDYLVDAAARGGRLNLSVDSDWI